MEIHAHTPKIGGSWSHWLLEGLFIVLSVGLAFAVADYREARANHELATRVLRSLRAEIEHNRKQVEPFLPLHQQWGPRLSALDLSHAQQTPLEAFVAARPEGPAETKMNFPTEVRRGAWDAALSTGALRFIDYDLVAALSEIYQVQAFYGQNIDRVVAAAASTAAFDPSSRAVVVKQLAYDLNQVAFAEKLLLDLYKRHAPAIRAAADEAHEAPAASNP
ncbi:MAG TPA: hypothetical protein VH583_25715 [Vicinamibacterales bacterium]